MISPCRKRNDYMRVRWARMELLFSSWAFIFCEEFKFYGYSSFRLSSSAPRGQRSHRPWPSPQTFPRSTVTLGISSNGGVPAGCITEHRDGGSGQTERNWKMFKLILLHHTNPAFGRAADSHNHQTNSDLLVDSARLHTMRVDASTGSHGRRVVGLLPYSPDFAPVEMLVSKVKATVAEFTIPLDLEAAEQLALYSACLSISPQDCSGAFASCREHVMAVLLELSAVGGPDVGMLDTASVLREPRVKRKSTPHLQNGAEVAI